jgi:hypothetical protein
MLGLWYLHYLMSLLLFGIEEHKTAGFLLGAISAYFFSKFLHKFWAMIRRDQEEENVKGKVSP